MFFVEPPLVNGGGDEEEDEEEATTLSPAIEAEEEVAFSSG